MRDTFRAVESELNATYKERREVVRGLLVGLLSRQHVLLIGPPGTAKSALARDLCERIGGTYFSWLLNRTSTPEELFGPVSLRALEQDSYRRIPAGKLPEAVVAFLDEIFKSNSAVLNLLLPVLNERVWYNDGAPAPIPLTMAVGASNELPEDRDELGALWDRFLLRYRVGYLQDQAMFVSMLAGAGAAQRTMIAADELAGAQAEVQAVQVDGILPTVWKVRTALVQHGIHASDRRFRTGLDIVRAQAWLSGRATASDQDLQILADVLWEEPEQRPEVLRAILEQVNPYEQQALTLVDEGTQIHANAMTAADTDKASAVGAEANAKLKRITQDLQKLVEQATQAGRDTEGLVGYVQQVITWNREVIGKCLGIAM